MLAENLYRRLKENGLKAVEYIQQGIVNECVEDVICGCIAIAGLCSVLACGGKQAAVSHSLYAYLCGAYPEQSQKFVHGELVCASLVYQFEVSGLTEEIPHFVDFCRQMGVPTCLKDLGMPTDSASMDQLFADLKQRMPVPDDREMERLRSHVGTLIG